MPENKSAMVEEKMGVNASFTESLVIPSAATYVQGAATLRDGSVSPTLLAPFLR